MEGFQLKRKKDTIGYWNTTDFEGQIVVESGKFFFETNNSKFDLLTTWKNPNIDLNDFVNQKLSVKGKLENNTLTIMALEVKEDDSERTTD